MANGVVLVAVGCLTGVLAGMLGAGGGFATVALLLAAGATPHVAVGTALVYMMVMGGWGAFMHVHLRSVDRRLALTLGTAAAVSALAGAQIAETLSGRDLALALALFTACVSGVSLAWPQTRRPVVLPADDPAEVALDDPPAGRVGGGQPDGGGATADNPRPYAYGQLRDALRLRVVPPAPRSPAPAPRPSPAAGAPLGGAVVGGSIIGLLKGLFGVGGAFLILPVMSRVGRVPRDVAVGSSLFAILVASLVAALRHWTLGNVDGSDLLALVPGGLFGSFVGARAARSMSPASIRRVFLAMMAASTIYLILFRSAYK
ncbi:MAG TPA: sulfite exporter TauE/SafE family protein [Acidimicrobiia bacterium]|nr:sulfite exporter TauE/SafE family protein [Acidimicrobiia bacterium]